MEKQLRILILEDLLDDAELIEHQLKKGDLDFISKVVETREQYEHALKEFQPDVVISDHSLPMFDSKLALQMFHSYRKIYNPAASFILVTGTVSEEFAVEIMKEGADDYILKDRLKRLPAAVRNALEKNKLRDQRRREEEEKLYLFDILQRSLHEIYVINSDTTKFEYVNNEALINLGYRLEEIVEMTPAHTIANFDMERFKRAVKHAEESKKGLIIERTALRKDGTTYPIQIHLQVIMQGDKRRILANVLDITEAKGLEEQKELANYIHNSFNYNRNLQESLERILEKLCLNCSCLAAEIYSREFDQPGSKLMAFYNPLISEGSTVGSSMAEEVYECREKRIFDFTSDLEILKKEDWIKKSSVKNAIAIPIYHGEELIAVIVGFLSATVTVEKKFAVLSREVQEKLAGNIKRKRSEEELQKIFDFSPDILTVLGKDGYVRKVNPALQNTLGYSPEEMLTMTYDKLIHPDDFQVLTEWRDLDLKDGEVAYYESRWLTR
ncbi:MAG TPA: PAS domain S-box protein, partial [Salinimicrobium catena]|nr:PAS domain S-box protein [Salinimicrobium catena]